MPKTMEIAKEYILYVGGYLDEEIVAERGLPTRNAAGSGRMSSIAEALRSAGERIVIISPAVSMRMRPRRLIHRSLVKRAGAVPVHFCAAVGLPIIGTILEPLFLMASLSMIRFRHRIKTVIFYNFSPALLLAALSVRFLLRISIVEDLEDVSVPRRTDWVTYKSTRPFQQTIFYVCMKLMIHLAGKVIMPTRRFLNLVSADKERLVITGCINTGRISSDVLMNNGEGGRPLNVLYSAGTIYENGMGELVGALRKLSQSKAITCALRIDICGAGTDTGQGWEKLKECTGIDIHSYGFVSDKEYKKLLSSADICLALQNPAGRYNKCKTPSKVYEYLTHGKVVIATDVGDLSLLPSEVIIICHPFNSSRLYEEILALAQNPVCILQRCAKAADYGKKNFSHILVGKTLKDFLSYSHIEPPAAEALT